MEHIFFPILNTSLILNISNVWFLKTKIFFSLSEEIAGKHENFSSYIWKRSYIFSAVNESFVSVSTENLGNKVLVQIFFFLSKKKKKKINSHSNFSTSPSLSSWLIIPFTFRALYRKSLRRYFFPVIVLCSNGGDSFLKSDGDILLVIKALIFSLVLTISHGHKTCRHILQRNYLCLQSSYLDLWVPDCIHKSGTWTSKWSKLHLQQSAPKMSKKDVTDRKRVEMGDENN